MEKLSFDQRSERQIESGTSVPQALFGGAREQPNSSVGRSLGGARKKEQEGKHEKTPERETKRAKMGAGEGKTTLNCAPSPSPAGPHPSGPTFSGSGHPLFWAPKAGTQHRNAGMYLEHSVSGSACVSFVWSWRHPSQTSARWMSLPAQTNQHR